MSLPTLLNQIKDQPQDVTFEAVMATIGENYRYNPTAFVNGELFNQSGTNEGSCKIFSFARLNQLDKQQTLACFGAYYRDDVLGSPQGNDHANIRNFIRQGWSGIEFKGCALDKV